VFGIRVRVYVCECVYLVFKCQTKREVKKSRHSLSRKRKRLSPMKK
jgi:hypothetical protein